MAVLEWIWNWILAPAIRTGTNALVGRLAGVPGMVAGAILGAIHGWRMAIAHSYDWSTAAGWVEFVVDNTWALPNSVVASIWAALNIWNRSEQSTSEGVGQLGLHSSWAGSYATTFGNVTAGTRVPRHERTHALQSRIFGPLLYPTWIAHYIINAVLPYWLIYHNARYPNSPITNFGQYFSRGVYPHTWAEEWAYSVEGDPP